MTHVCCCQDLRNKEAVPGGREVNKNNTSAARAFSFSIYHIYPTGHNNIKLQQYKPINRDLKAISNSIDITEKIKFKSSW